MKLLVRIEHDGVNPSTYSVPEGVVVLVDFRDADGDGEVVRLEGPYEGPLELALREETR